MDYGQYTNVSLHHLSLLLFYLDWDFFDSIKQQQGHQSINVYSFHQPHLIFQEKKGNNYKSYYKSLHFSCVAIYIFILVRYLIEIHP